MTRFIEEVRSERSELAKKWISQLAQLPVNVDKAVVTVTLLYDDGGCGEVSVEITRNG